jgi:16S rRNA (adenine1518-N6/adenine1519-N6)-dimethyltransferase
LRANKRLGQHFLADPAILNWIADALDPAPGETVIEIGPGRGSLTEVLLARGLRVIGIEKDRRLAADLRESGVGSQELGSFTVVEGDALRVDWHELVRAAPTPDSRFPTPFKVAGNIPYNITSPLLEKALTPPLPERIVFLVQDEVAQRAAAAPGSRTYGGLSVGVQAVCRVERLFIVAPGAFRPAPKVRSALVRLTPHAEALVRSDEVVPFRRFVTACFGRRRKQLRNVVAGVTARPAAEVARALLAMGLDPAARPETLAPRDFVRLLRWSREL